VSTPIGNIEPKPPKKPRTFKNGFMYGFLVCAFLIILLLASPLVLAIAKNHDVRTQIDAMTSDLSSYFFGTSYNLAQRLQANIAALHANITALQANNTALQANNTALQASLQACSLATPQEWSEINSIQALVNQSLIWNETWTPTHDCWNFSCEMYNYLVQREPMDANGTPTDWQVEQVMVYNENQSIRHALDAVFLGDGRLLFLEPQSGPVGGCLYSGLTGSLFDPVTGGEYLSAGSMGLVRALPPGSILVKYNPNGYHRLRYNPNSIAGFWFDGNGVLHWSWNYAWAQFWHLEQKLALKMGIVEDGEYIIVIGTAVVGVRG
jgi:cell division protein FtsB